LSDLSGRLGVGKARLSKAQARKSMERTTGHVVTASRCVMLPAKHLLNHIEALLRLSHDAKDRAVSAKLREMADEFRIMVSVADVTDFAAELSQKAVPVAAVGRGPGFTRQRSDSGLRGRSE
jgi:hypothetical protein